MRAFFDVSAGVAGDMLLGALVDAGASLPAIQAAVDVVAPGLVRLSASEVRRGGFRATKVTVEPLVAEAKHRHWVEIDALLAAAALPDLVKESARAVFSRLAVAEARAHGVPKEAVHFHEVGAWDSIADIVGVAAALAELGVTKVTGSTLAVGSGSVATEHGRLPVPAPAVAELLTGWPLTPSQPGCGELATPTGVAVLQALGRPGELDFPVAQVGVGAGSKDFADWANVVRVFIGTKGSAAAEPGEPLVEIRANVDDLESRLWPGVLDSLLAAGAVDAWLTPISMKKGRPAQQVSALVSRANQESVLDALFAATPTFGIRWSTVDREVLARHFETVTLAGVPIRVKVGQRAGQRVSATLEYADLAAAAVQLGLSEREVQRRALAAFSAADGPAGSIANRDE